VPYGIYSVKITLFLIYFERSLFLTVLFEVMPMLPAPEHNLESPSFIHLTNYEQWPSIPLHSGSIPLACGVIELPYCTECFSNMSCKMHSCKAEWSLYTSNKSRLSINTLNYMFNWSWTEKRIVSSTLTNFDSNFSSVIL